MTEIRLAEFLAVLFPFLLSSCVKSEQERAPVGRSRILIENFENDTHRSWHITGDAFSWNLATPVQLAEWGDCGYEGDHIMTGWLSGDAGTGTMTSPTFLIELPYINFLVGGGGDIENVYAELIVDGNEVFRESGSNSRTMEQVVWNVSAYVGSKAEIRLVDNSTRPWGFLMVDYFYQSSKPAVSRRSREMKIGSRYLNFPVSSRAPMGTFRVEIDGKTVYDADLRLTDGTPEYWVHKDCSEWLGKTISIVIPFNQNLDAKQHIACGNALSTIYQSDEPAEKESFYSESLRPQVHFTSARGWLNDPCGLVYAGDEWHLSYQHNMFGTDWGNMSWGHAVSSDLVHWKECSDVLLPDESGSMFTGYSVIDADNVLGLGSGGIPTVVAYYTAAGEYNYISRDKPFTTCMAYSTDGGMTYVKHGGNPVLPEVEFQNRDPHVVWSPEDNCWVMVLFLGGNTYGFFESNDLEHFTERSRMDIPGSWECPDFYRAMVAETGEWLWVFTGVHNSYYVGRFSNGRFTPLGGLRKQDAGSSLLAAHTFAGAPDSRIVQIGCIGGSRFPNLPFDEMMCFPKELSLHHDSDGYSLRAVPVREIERLYGNVIRKSNFSLGEKDSAVSASAAALHFKAVVDAGKTTAQAFGAIVDGVNVSWSPKSGSVTVSGGSLASPVTMNGIMPDGNGKMTLEIISDTGLIEVFAGDGRLSATLFNLTGASVRELRTTASSGTVAYDCLTLAELRPFWK